MLDLNKMIDSAHECIGWPYESPGTNDKNGIDCSGMFVKMYRDQGAKIYHGSNTIFREYCSETGKITSAKDLQVGMAVFKCKPWTDADKGSKWYGTEPGNLSHIGFVTSVNPLEITHCTSPVAKTDSTIGKWAYWGKLKDVGYGTDPGPSHSPDPSPSPEPDTRRNMYTYAENGKPINLRVKASTKAKLVDKVPVGQAVTWLKDNGAGWAYIQWGWKKGWMLDCYLVDNPQPTPTPEPDPEPEKGYALVTGKNLALRQGPGTNKAVITRIPTGKTVKLLEVPEDWQYVEYNGKTGFVMKKYIREG